MTGKYSMAKVMEQYRISIAKHGITEEQFANEYDRSVEKRGVYVYRWVMRNRVTREPETYRFYTEGVWTQNASNWEWRWIMFMAREKAEALGFTTFEVAYMDGPVVSGGKIPDVEPMARVVEEDVSMKLVTSPDRKAGWIKIFNIIVQWKHSNYAPLFSEREGVERFVHIPFTPYRFRVGIKRG